MSIKLIPNSPFNSTATTVTTDKSLGVGTSTPTAKLEVDSGVVGDSGVKLSQLNATSSATGTASKVLSLDNTGKVILANVPGTQNIVTFSVNTNPNTAGTIFDPNQPLDENVVYVSDIDNNTWVYNGSSYVTYVAPASTEWNLAGTTNDAGSNKTSAISRTGAVGVGISVPTANISSAANTVASNDASYAIHANSSGNTAKKVMLGYDNTADAGILQAAHTGVTWKNTSINPNGGNVGIGRTNPSQKLDVLGNARFQNLTTNNQFTIDPSNGTGPRLMLGNNTTANAYFEIGAYNSQNNFDTKGRDLQFFGTTSGNAEGIMLKSSGGQVGINNRSPFNQFQVNPDQGTVGTASQSGTTVTGVGTAFSSVMVGRLLYYTNGVFGGTITAVASATSMTVSTSQTVTSQTFKVKFPSLNVTTTGLVGVNTSVPVSNFEARGSVGYSVLSITANTTLDITHNYVIIPLGSAFTVTLPAATGISGRCYTVTNKSAGAKTIGSYVNLSGATVTTVAASSSIELISDGTVWQQIK